MIKPPYRGFVNNGSYTYTSPSGVTSANSGFVSDQTGSFQSVRTPGFRNIPKHLLPNNPFHHSQVDTTYKPGLYGTISWGIDWAAGGIWKWMPYYYSGHIYGQVSAYSSAPFASSSSDDSDTKARNAVLDRVRGSSASLGMAFVERKQTVGMIAKNVNRIATAALAIRRGNLKHAAELFGLQKVSGRNLRNSIPPSPKNLSNHWLEYSYGWRPLLNDIYDSCELLADTYYRQKPTVVTATGKHKFKKVGYLVSEGSLHTETCDTTSESSTRYLLRFVESNAFLRVAEKTGLSNPALLVWEAIPYSFVIDWILPVGSYLQNLNATAGLSFHSGTVSTRVITNHVTTLNPKVQGNDQVLVSGGRIVRSELKSRQVLSSFPSPVLAPDFSALGVNRVISALALLTQAFRR